MKYTIFCIALLSFYSCTRTNDVAHPSPVDSTKTENLTPLIDSIYIYILGPKEINKSISKFNYDSRGRLTGFHNIIADTTSSNQTFADTVKYIFSYQGTDSLPNSYTIWANGNVLSPDGTYHHILKYDDSGRVLIDSESVTQTADHYSYSNADFTLQNPYGLDSFFIVGGNLSYYIFPFERHFYTYSGYANPAYLSQFGTHFGNILPFTMSRNLFNHRQNSYSASWYNVDYSWTTNADHQVIYGVGIAQSTGLPIEYYRYVYKK